MIVVDVENASSKLKGLLSRRLLEIRPGLFVGSLSRRATEQLWNDVLGSNTPSAFLAFPAKNELGFGILSTGVHRYEVVDNYGLPLVKYHRKVGGKSDTQ